MFKLGWIQNFGGKIAFVLREILTLFREISPTTFAKFHEFIENVQPILGGMRK
jgi:hypothetical protein